MMVEARPDEELISMVRRGGGRAFTAMGDILYNQRDYPGDVNDVFGLLSDSRPISFCYSPSHLAQAYLFHKGLIRRSDLDGSWQVDEFLKYWENGDGHD